MALLTSRSGNFNNGLRILVVKMRDNPFLAKQNIVLFFQVLICYESKFLSLMLSALLNLFFFFFALKFQLSCFFLFRVSMFKNLQFQQRYFKIYISGSISIKTFLLKNLYLVYPWNSFLVQFKDFLFPFFSCWWISEKLILM